MIILAAVIVITITSSDIITKSKNAATDYNLTQLEQAAQVIYSDYLLDVSVSSGYATTGEYIREKLVKDGTLKDEDKYYFNIDDTGNITDVKDIIKSADYIIYSIEDLVQLSNNVNSGNNYNNQTVVLARSLDFTKHSSYSNYETTLFGDINENGTVETLINELTTAKGFNPIGEYDHPFVATFNGLNNKILGLYIKREADHEDQCLGFFGRAHAPILNIEISGNITGSAYIGGIVGLGEGPMYNCHSNVTIYADSSLRLDSIYVGGLAGIYGGNSRLDIDSCSNKGNLYIGEKTQNIFGVGGLIGTGDSVNITNSYNAGNIYGSSGYYPTADPMGGLVGYTYEISICNSYNLGNISTSDTYTAGTIGLIGTDRYQGCVIKNIYNGIDFVNKKIEQITKIINNIPITIENAYYISTGTNTLQGATSKTLAEIKSRTFVDLLNANVAAYNSANPTEVKWKNWKTGTDGYPVLAN